MYFTYILKSAKNGSYYVGSTENLERRLIRHNSGQNKSTRNACPWSLVYSRAFETRKEAMAFEKKIKAWKKREMIEKQISET